MTIKKIREKFKPKYYFTNSLCLSKIPTKLLGRIRIEEIEQLEYVIVYNSGLESTLIWTSVNAFDDDIEELRVEDATGLKFDHELVDVMNITGNDRIYVSVCCPETGELSYRCVHFDRIAKEKRLGTVTQLYDIRADRVVDDSPVSIVGADDETEQFNNIQMLMFEMNA